VPPEAVDDLVSETFLVVWRRLEDVPEPPLPWLLTVAAWDGLTPAGAACRPSSTSWVGVYLLSGGVICSCDASNVAESSNTRGADRFMHLRFANSSPGPFPDG